MSNKLAIVIPAYKNKFLDKTLESISKQTCKRFKLYIGDDNSPYQLETIVKQWENQMDIKYQRFESNVGGSNLVAQWNRCIDLIEGEEWIWLFSDDDIMSPDCVDKFYKQIDNSPRYNLFHFDTILIDDLGKEIKSKTNYPKIISSGEYIDLCYRWRDRTNGVSFIFNRDHFISIGGFQNFDLAWGSDQATWIKLSRNNGIYTIPNTCVYWRYGNSSISSDWNMETTLRKKNAFLSFMKWRQKYCVENNIITDTSNVLKSIYLIRHVRHYKALSYHDKKCFLKDGLRIMSCNLLNYYISYLILFILLNTFDKVKK